MENNMLITVLITIVSVGILSTLVYLVSTVRNLKDRVKTLSLEMVDFKNNNDNYQLEIRRDFSEIHTSMETRLDRVYRKMDKQSSDTYDYITNVEKSLPDTIRKTIGHIEFARPLDKII
jgi:uncharacterized membrane-anchored protein YhcB (DUF1043 family)